jgi:hypothetical protein
MRSFAFVLVLAACSGSNPPNIDADPRGPACTGSAYDLCVTEHDCPTTAAPLCHTFQSDGFQVCTTACTAGGTDTCPAGGTCNAMGICKPTAANMCHL